MYHLLSRIAIEDGVMKFVDAHNLAGNIPYLKVKVSYIGFEDTGLDYTSKILHFQNNKNVKIDYVQIVVLEDRNGIKLAWVHRLTSVR